MGHVLERRDGGQGVHLVGGVASDEICGNDWGASAVGCQMERLPFTQSTGCPFELGPHRGRAGWGNRILPRVPLLCLEEAAVTLSRVLMSPGVYLFSVGRERGPGASGTGKATQCKGRGRCPCPALVPQPTNRPVRRSGVEECRARRCGGGLGGSPGSPLLWSWASLWSQCLLAGPKAELPV